MAHQALTCSRAHIWVVYLFFLLVTGSQDIAAAKTFACPANEPALEPALPFYPVSRRRPQPGDAQINNGDPFEPPSYAFPLFTTYRMGFANVPDQPSHSLPRRNFGRMSHFHAVQVEHNGVWEILTSAFLSARSVRKLAQPTLADEIDNAVAVPLPPGLPLFAGGLSLLVILGYRRRDR